MLSNRDHPGIAVTLCLATVNDASRNLLLTASCQGISVSVFMSLSQDACIIYSLHASLSKESAAKIAILIMILMAMMAVCQRRP